MLKTWSAKYIYSYPALLQAYNTINHKTCIECKYMHMIESPLFHNL